MTRLDQKAAERRILDELLFALRITPEGDVEEDEKPDFLVPISGQIIGIEVTMYQSGTSIVPKIGRRQVEAEWEKFCETSRASRLNHPDISRANVGLMFKDVVPSRKEHEAFIIEIVDFIRSRLATIETSDVTYWPYQFNTPLMMRYLQSLWLRDCEFAEWYSNITAGYVSLPDNTLIEIVNCKATKMKRQAHTYWLIIQSGHRISELVLDLNGVDDFNGIAGLTEAMLNSPFSKIFIPTYRGIFQWQAAGWKMLPARALRK